MSWINPMYNAMCFSILLGAMDKIGVSLPLVARQASELLAPIVRDVAKMIFGIVPEKLDELISLAKNILERDRVAEKVEISTAEKQIKMRISGCMFLDVITFSKVLGYDACPICLLALVSTATLSALKLAEVSRITFKNNGSECSIELVLLS